MVLKMPVNMCIIIAIAIAVVGVMAMSGTHIPGDIYAWVVVFVLPLNSAINPWLYSIPAIKKKVFHFRKHTVII